MPFEESVAFAEPIPDATVAQGDNEHLDEFAWTEADQEIADALLDLIQRTPAQHNPAGPEKSDLDGPQPDEESANDMEPFSFDPGQTQRFAPLPGDPIIPSRPQPETQVAAPVPAQSTPAPAPVKSYRKLKHGGATIMYRRGDGLINATQLLRATGYTKTIRWSALEKKLGQLDKIVAHGRSTAGTYVSMATAQSILQALELEDAVTPALMRHIERLT